MKKELQDRTLSLEKKYNKAKEEWRLSKEEINILVYEEYSECRTF